MRVSIQTLGCKVNFAEMAQLGDRLARAGFTVSETEADPDICVINSCTVTAQADRKVRTLVHGLRRRHPRAHLILTGCHVDNPHPRLSAIPSADIAFPNARKHEIFDYVSSNFQAGASGHTTIGRARFFLKVQDGCDHRCTYCIVWRTRGASTSDPEDRLIDRAQQAVAEGYREIVLTGVDLGSFGRDGGGSLASFTRRLLDATAPARVRLSSVNANDFTPELIELIGSPRLCRHLHIPLQSGSDQVLKRMGRLYRRQRYIDLVASIRQRSADAAFTTDVIVGFPGESDADFAETAGLAREVGFSGMHVFRYSPRAGTAAPRLGLPVDDPVSRERSRRLQEQAEQQRAAYERRFLNRDMEVIWDRRLPNRVRGLSDNYITIYAPDRGQPLGTQAAIRPRAVCADGLLAD
ncbi:MAG TPA: tRNA (N(6)-L-threonylcarbamoyladenosine(37)-C(2))-methylthiotransferase MtaB [Candidatus Dormibacteraeota bacterium]|jgi:threonylcarbamoyladenosine tRNA methylthiotransferase MtaB